MFEDQKTKVYSAFTFGPAPTEAAVIADFLKPAPAAAEWHEREQEGQLAVDVLETAEEVVVVAPMAGTKPENIELHLHNDFLTIRGRRELPVEGIIDSFHEENYWGVFSRTIVLPVHTRSELTSSEYRNGVLTVRLPKAIRNNSIPIMVIDE